MQEQTGRPRRRSATARVATVRRYAFLSAAIVSGLAACGDDDDVRVNVPGGPGGGGGTVERPDAGMADARPDAAVTTARVCVLVDLRDWASCDNASTAADLLVTVNGQTEVTDAAGHVTFTSVVPQGAWATIVGAGVRPSLSRWGTRLVAIRQSVWSQVAIRSDIELAAAPAIAARFVDADGAPVPMVVANSEPNGAIVPLYDTNEATLWSGSATGPNGIGLMTSLPSDVAFIDVEGNGGNLVWNAQLPIIADGTTFATLVAAE